MLPTRFVASGIVFYVFLELLAALSFEFNIIAEQQTQGLMLVLRLLELMGFIFLIQYFRMFDSLGLRWPGQGTIQRFAVIATGCVGLAAILYAIEPAWFAVVTLPVWLSGFSGLLLMVVIAPAVEELVFRGLVYRMLREQWGVLISVAVSAVFFSLMHQGLLISPQLAGGIIFALAYEWSKSLWVAIGLHMGANASVYLLATWN